MKAHSRAIRLVVMVVLLASMVMMPVLPVFGQDATPSGVTPATAGLVRAGRDDGGSCRRGQAGMRHDRIADRGHGQRPSSFLGMVRQFFGHVFRGRHRRMTDGATPWRTDDATPAVTTGTRGERSMTGRDRDGCRHHRHRAMNGRRHDGAGHGRGRSRMNGGATPMATPAQP